MLPITCLISSRDCSQEASTLAGSFGQQFAFEFGICISGLGMSSKIDIVLQEPLPNGRQDGHFRNATSKNTFRRCRSAPAADCGSMKLKPEKISGFGTKGSAPTAKAVLFLLIYLSTGILCFLDVKDDLHGTKTISLVDALYFCVVTMTTVGYGDLVPATTSAKLMTCLFVFVGFGLVGLMLGNAANYLVEKQERLLEKAIENRENYLDATPDSRIKRMHWKVSLATVLVLILFAVGISVLMCIEGLSFVDSFYCVCATVTTLGYGDHSFRTTGGRIFAIVWILVSTVCVAQLLLYIAEMVTEGRQQALTKWVLSRKITYSEFEAADMDDDGALSIAEFIVYKLKAMGKIEEDDVAAIVKQFQELDVDESGTITLSDINSAQLLS